MSGRIDKTELIKKLRDLEGLTDEEKSNLIGLLRQHKKYGLVWEDKPEDVEERLREELPVLKEVKERALISDQPDAPNHILIEGDNLEALTALSYTHEGKIDVIYIDPPYNTGNKDFVYNDSYVDTEDSYRHSKWLSFMSKRLRIAKRLLSDKGVIFISIDDNEQAGLKMLCDEVFGQNNFVAQFIWRGGKRNLAKYVSTSHEYMLFYAKNLSHCSELGVNWKEKKNGLDEIYKTVKECLKQSSGDCVAATKLLKAWFKALPANHPSKDHEHYCNIDSVGVYCMDNVSRVGGGKYSVVSPKTGSLIEPPSRGWTYGNEADFWEAYKQGKIEFTDNDTLPVFKRYLKDNETQLLETVFYKDRRSSSKRLKELMGSDVFQFPKDEEIICHFLEVFSLPKSTILDFFAGSGTTLHATMLLNAEDDGHRNCILVTNNENGICEQVTYERNKRVIEGYTTPKGQAVEGLSNNNLRYYRTNFISRERTQRNMRALVNAATDLLCIKENLYKEKPSLGTLKLKPQLARYFSDGQKHMLVVYREEVVNELVEAIKPLELGSSILKIYIFSPGRYAFDDDFYEVQNKVQLVALPAAIYDAYQRVLPKQKERLLDEAEEPAPQPTTSEMTIDFEEGGEQ